ncbi:Phloem 2-B15-like protein [Theobroma cacao]|uniref:Phloem 2-B15-like protein n=1 Tax=Theobroma cacao TaxID=3641 RepID=A0A061F2J4_THECC|nr:Phloem 2-B15-like protein [Theobroma cacao]
MNLDQLPQDCFAQILSLASPIDACRISVLSSTIRVAADSDNVWEKFLPSDYQDILSRLLHPLVYSSKKKLFLRLCNPHLIDGGHKSMALENRSMPIHHVKGDMTDCECHGYKTWMAIGKKRYVLSAKELKTWAENPLFWTWKSFPASRIQSRMLSPDIVHEAHLIVKFVDRAYGLDILPSKVSVEVGDVKSEGTVRLRQHETKKQCLETTWFSNQVEASTSMGFRGTEERVPCKRADGWTEIELGNFYNHGSGDAEVKMCLQEVAGTHLKAGLVVEGIELRPKQFSIIPEVAELKTETNAEKSRVIEGDDRVFSKREDGWREIEVKEFFNGEGDEEVKMSSMEVNKGHQLKGVLIVDGIEVRPKS